MSDRLTIRTATLAEVYAAHQQVPELGRAADYAERIDGRFHIALIAESHGQTAGFKLGYARAPEDFYSWVGGVAPAHRGLGIASALLQRQETLAAEAGYITIRVKSMNRYPAMLRLLLANGYLIEGYEPNSGPDDAKILFRKILV